MEEEKKNNNKKAILAGVILALVVAALFGVYQFTKQKTSAGDKSITVKFVYDEKRSETYKYDTSREFLGEVLKDEKAVEGEDGPYGLYITSAQGVTADESKQEWWCLTKGGEQVNSSADQTPIADGDVFELTLTVGY